MESASVAPTLRSPQSRPLVELIEQEDARRRRRRRTWAAVAAVIPVAAVAIWYAWLRPAPLPLAARFRTEPVSTGDVLRDVRATGRLEAVTTVRVGAEISGRIEAVLVDYNATVRAGQVLARFDRSTLMAQLRQADALVRSTRAAVAQARTDHERAVRELARAEALLSGGYLSQADRDAAADAARLAAQRVEASEAQVGAQAAAAAAARTALDHAVITSPIDGIVISRNVDPGQTVVSVLQTPDLFVVAADLRQMRVIAGVDEADIGELVAGQRARFTVNAYPNRWFDGVVTDIRNSPSVIQDVVTYGTVVEVANPDLALKPGMTAAVRIRTAEARGALRVPAAALAFQPPGGKVHERLGVWILEHESLRWIPVQPGASDGEFTAVSGSLDPGAPVIVDLTPVGRAASGVAR
jgi:HlyD family secretion protein